MGRPSVCATTTGGARQQTLANCDMGVFLVYDRTTVNGIRVGSGHPVKEVHREHDSAREIDGISDDELKRQN